MGSTLNEEWRDIPGHKGRYRVSNYGNVFSLISGRTITPSPIRSGHLQLTLMTHGMNKRHYVHRLVAAAFLPKKDGCDKINHRDFDPRNNRVDNLEWCTQAQNVAHSAKAGRMGASPKLKQTDILDVHDMLKLGWSQRTIAAYLGVTHGVIGDVLARKGAYNEGAR